MLLYRHKRRGQKLWKVTVLSLVQKQGYELMNHLSQDRNRCATKKRNHSQTFYKLTTAEADLIAASGNLTSPELRVYIFLLPRLPFIDSSTEIDTAFISEHLNMNRQSVQRAVRSLRKKCLIDYQVVKAKYSRGKANIGFTEELDGFPDDGINNNNKGQNILSKDKISALETKYPSKVQNIHQQDKISANRIKSTLATAETPTVQSFQNPSDSTDYKDFKTHTNHPPTRSVCVNIDFDEETRAYLKAVANCQESEYSPTPVEHQESQNESLSCSTNSVDDKSSAGIDVLVYKSMIEKLGVRFEAVVKQLREHPENIQSALASLQEAKDMNQCKNPTGYLKKALIEGWMPEKQQYLAPLNATTKSPSQMSDEEWMIYLANTLTRERRNQLIRFVVPGALGERIAVLANGIKMSFAQAKQMTVQQFEQMAMA